MIELFSSEYSNDNELRHRTDSLKVGLLCSMLCNIWQNPSPSKKFFLAKALAPVAIAAI